MDFAAICVLYYCFLINYKMRVQFQTNKIFNEFNGSLKRFRVFQGGTRSGKTYNLAFAWIMKLLKEEHKTLTIARETMPALKQTVFKDFEEVMKRLNLWNEDSMKWTTMDYKLGTNTIEFRKLDDAQKVKGAKRNYLWLNEANEVPYPIFKQLIWRTSEIIVLDYNPSDEFHWIYDQVIPRPDCDYFESTYLDNPFLPDEQVMEIERMRDTDPNYWRIYGLGQRGVAETTIYRNWEIFKGHDWPQGEKLFGNDFGFNDPNAVVEVTFVDQCIYVKELLYQSQMTTPDLIKFYGDQGISRTAEIYGDSARPDTIEEIYQAGYNMKPCSKGPGSIKAGIDWIKRHKVIVHPESLNLIKELRSYKWKIDKNEKILDEPVDINNHLLDALRYAMTSRMQIQDSYELAEPLDVAF